MKFSFQMDEAEKAETRALQTEHLRQALDMDMIYRVMEGS